MIEVVRPLLFCALFAIGLGGCQLVLDFDEETAPEVSGELPDLFEDRDDVPLAFNHPDDCKTCHENQYNEWQTSAHAYAMADPVFRAMVKMGQADTEGKLGQFCVQCHSPTGLATGQSEVFFDATNNVFDQRLDMDPIAMSGVTCTACHTMTQVIEPVNARVVYTPNGILQGPFDNPEPNEFHGSAYNPLFDDSLEDFGRQCGACHNVVSPKGALIEQTFPEFVASTAKAMGKTCVTCHMPEYIGKASTGPDAPDGLTDRMVHRHTFAGVDVSLLAPGVFPGDVQMAATASALLQESVEFAAVYSPGTMTIDTSITNLAGHAVPSGSTAERQMWIELIVENTAVPATEVFSSGTLTPEGDLRDGIMEHNTMAGTDLQLAYYGQILIAIDGFADMSADAKAIARAQIDLDCLPFGRGATASGSLGQPVEMPWQADWQCDNLVAADAIAVDKYDMSALPAGSYTATARLLYRTFPPFFLRKLEVGGGLDPMVKTRLPIVEMEATSINFTVSVVQ